MVAQKIKDTIEECLEPVKLPEEVKIRHRVTINAKLGCLSSNIFHVKLLNNDVFMTLISLKSPPMDPYFHRKWQ